MAISIHLEGADILETELRDAPGVTGRAVVRALRRAIGSARTFMVREMALDTGLKSKDVRDSLRMMEPSLGNPTAQLSATLKRIPLIRFDARGPEPSRGLGRGVSYRLGVSRRRLPHAFIATMQSGHRGVFARVPGGRRRGPAPHRSQLPIVQLHGPSLGRVFEKFQAAAQAVALEAFQTNFDHELNFAAKQSAAQGGSSAGAD